MTPSDLLMDLIDLGVRLKAIDDRLTYMAPPGTMTDELVAQLREHKAEVIALMARRTCTTCGSFGRCERRVPTADGGWACQAALGSGLLADPVEEAQHQRRLVPATPLAERREAPGQMVMEQVEASDASGGCGERVPVRTVDGVEWVRCTGRDTCDGVCSRAALWTKAAS